MKLQHILLAVLFASFVGQGASAMGNSMRGSTADIERAERLTNYVLSGAFAVAACMGIYSWLTEEDPNTPPGQAATKKAPPPKRDPGSRGLFSLVEGSLG